MAHSDSLWLSLAKSGSLWLSLSSSLRRSSAHKVLARFGSYSPIQFIPPSGDHKSFQKSPLWGLQCFFCKENEVRGWPYQNFGIWGGYFCSSFVFLRHGESYFQFGRRTSMGPDHGWLLVFIKCFTQSQTNSCYSYLSDATKVFPCPMNDFLAYLSIPLSESCPTVSNKLTLTKELLAQGRVPLIALLC